MEASLYSVVKSIVDEHSGHSFSPQDDQNTISFDLPDGRHTEVKVDVQKHIVMVYSSASDLNFNGEDRVKALVKFMARVNESLYFGNVEFNFDTGNTRYKTSQIFQGISDPSNSIRFLLDQHKTNFPKLRIALRDLNQHPEKDLAVLVNEATQQTS